MNAMITVSAENVATTDSGRVRLGAMSPTLPERSAAQAKVVADAVKDSGKVRLGAMSPSL